MRDMARKHPKEISAISAMAGVRLGQAMPEMRGKLLGTRLVRMMPGEKAGHEERELQAHDRQ